MRWCAYLVLELVLVLLTLTLDASAKDGNHSSCYNVGFFDEDVIKSAWKPTLEYVKCQDQNRDLAEKSKKRLFPEVIFPVPPDGGLPIASMDVYGPTLTPTQRISLNYYYVGLAQGHACCENLKMEQIKRVARRVAVQNDVDLVLGKQSITIGREAVLTAGKDLTEKMLVFMNDEHLP